MYIIIVDKVELKTQIFSNDVQIIIFPAQKPTMRNISIKI